MDAEYVEAQRNRPIHQRRFFEIADAVGVQRDPVAAEDDLASGLGVHGIGVVEQRRMEEAGDVNQRPGCDNAKKKKLATCRFQLAAGSEEEEEALRNPSAGRLPSS